MNEEQQAAQSIGKFLQLVKGLGELKPGLESLGSVRQAEQETKSRLSALKIDEASLISKTQQLRVEIGELEKKAKAATERGKADGEAELKRAKALGIEMVEQAKADMSALIVKAKADLEEIEGSIERAQAREADCNAKAKVAKQRLDATNAELDRIVQRARG